MDEKKTPGHETIRLLFELDWADDPQLYDDLIRFKKGTKRINRLRLLAHEGVVGQLNIVASGVVPRLAHAPVAMPPSAGSPIEVPLASDVFGEPITDR